jgi:hypothetical protein
MRLGFLLVAIAVTGCAGQNKPLPMVKDSDPVVHLNPDQWSATVNDLIHPPGDGAPVKAGKL